MKIGHLNKADVLIVLYNAAKINTESRIPHNPFFDLTKEKANILLAQKSKIEFLNGKALNIDLSGDQLNTVLYNLKNGNFAAENALYELDILLGFDETPKTETMISMKSLS